jgi:hypothetical protein
LRDGLEVIEARGSGDFPATGIYIRHGSDVEFITASELFKRLGKPELA